MMFKTLPFRTLLLIALVSPVFLSVSCTRDADVQSTTMGSAKSMIPEMLPRNPSIGSPEEQAKTRQIYDELTQKILNNPNDYTSRLKLAQLFMLEARATGEHGHYYPATLKVLDGILAEAPTDDIEFGATSLKASVLLSLHQFEEAKAAGERAVALNGYNAVVYGSLVDANVELGNYEEAVKMSDKMNSIRPDLRSYSRVSYLREIYGDLDGAIEAMTQAAESGYPGFEETAWCRLTLGTLYEQKGDLNSAKAQYERILQERTDYPFAIAALARIASKQGNPQLAESHLKDAMEIIPEVSFYVDLATLYQEQGRTAEKDELLKHIFVMLEEDEEAGHVMNLEYARIYLELMDNPQKAMEYADKEYAVRPDNIDVNLVMAEILLAANEPERARHHIDVASRTGNQNPRLLLTKGLIDLKSFETDSGKALVAKALELDPYQSGWMVEEYRELSAGF